MKRFLLVLAALVIGGSVVMAQWSWQSPPLSLENLNRVSFITANTGFIIANHGVAYKTTDGGTNWTQMRTPEHIVCR
jgi:photosystem II stability/assembly factor-like uncharacterized protein